jgi:hypothetical protein
MELVQELRNVGLVQGRDFDFSYTPESYNSGIYEAVNPRYVVFKFYVEKWATWFILKYGQG